jgi:hypothetical protein
MRAFAFLPSCLIHSLTQTGALTVRRITPVRSQHLLSVRSTQPPEVSRRCSGEGAAPAENVLSACTALHLHPRHCTHPPVPTLSLPAKTERVCLGPPFDTRLQSVSLTRLRRLPRVFASSATAHGLGLNSPLALTEGSVCCHCARGWWCGVSRSPVA